ncbi:MAG: N-acetyltransferase [Myxococcales bacterium]|nr:N-acetyltransferase [Myxococcales bacterium]
MTTSEAGAEPQGVAVRVVSRIDEIDAAAWDACAGDEDPFVSHAFLHALEESGSASADEGWLPQHLVIEGADGRIAAVAPTYVKGHSYGEYVFDWSWASAYRRAGIEYYPKLQCCVPFSPVGGSRLLVRPDATEVPYRRVLLAAMVEMTVQSDLSGAHMTFCTEEEYDLAGELGLLQRTGTQYHFFNEGYESYDDFLAALLGRKRKVIKRERREAQSCGATVRAITGDELRPEHWEAFYGFYLSTIDRKWASPYLTKDFFFRIGETMPERIVLMLAEQDGQPVAGALNLLGKKALYGRYWGSSADHKFLHFETCYHRAIELAIELGLERVEAGAQGQHKIQRGYVPVPTYSAHFIVHPKFRRAIDDFLQHERQALAEERRALMAQSPFREHRAR